MADDATTPVTGSDQVFQELIAYLEASPSELSELLSHWQALTPQLGGYSAQLQMENPETQDGVLKALRAFSSRLQAAISSNKTPGNLKNQLQAAVTLSSLVSATEYLLNLNQAVTTIIGILNAYSPEELHRIGHRTGTDHDEKKDEEGTHEQDRDAGTDSKQSATTSDASPTTARVSTPAATKTTPLYSNDTIAGQIANNHQLATEYAGLFANKLAIDLHHLAGQPVPENAMAALPPEVQVILRREAYTTVVAAMAAGSFDRVALLRDSMLGIYINNPLLAVQLEQHFNISTAESPFPKPLDPSAEKIDASLAAAETVATVTAEDSAEAQTATAIETQLQAAASAAGQPQNSQSVSDQIYQVLITSGAPPNVAQSTVMLIEQTTALHGDPQKVLGPALDTLATDVDRARVRDALNLLSEQYRLKLAFELNNSSLLTPADGDDLADLNQGLEAVNNIPSTQPQLILSAAHDATGDVTQVLAEHGVSPSASGYVKKLQQSLQEEGDSPTLTSQERQIAKWFHQLEQRRGLVPHPSAEDVVGDTWKTITPTRQMQVGSIRQYYDDGEAYGFEDGGGGGGDYYDDGQSQIYSGGGGGAGSSGRQLPPAKTMQQWWQRLRGKSPASKEADAAKDTTQAVSKAKNSLLSLKKIATNLKSAFDKIKKSVQAAGWIAKIAPAVTGFISGLGALLAPILPVLAGIGLGIGGLIGLYKALEGLVGLGKSLFGVASGSGKVFVGSSLPNGAALSSSSLTSATSAAGTSGATSGATAASKATIQSALANPMLQLGAAGGTTGILLITTATFYNIFISPLPTSESLESPYVSITKEAIQNSTTITELENSQIPTTLTYRITITPKDEYQLLVKNYFDTLGVSFNQTRYQEQGKTAPQVAANNRTSANNEFTVVKAAENSVLAPGQEMILEYQQDLASDWQDATVLNTFSLQFDYSSPTESGTDETASAKANVCIGECPVAQAGLWPSCGLLFQNPYDNPPYDNDPATKGSHAPGVLEPRGEDAFDIAAVANTPVHAPFTGQVCAQNYMASGYGTYLIQNQIPGANFQVYYAHLSSTIFGSSSSGCQNVSAGDLIGYTGASGTQNNAAYHLHYEIRPQTGLQSRIVDYVPDRGLAIRSQITKCYANQ